MFRRLTEFSFQRTVAQAFGFWLAYLVLGVLIGTLGGGVYVWLVGGGIAEGFQAVRAIGIVYALAVSLVVCIQKRLGFIGYLLAVVSALLAFFGGVALGLIPTAFLTTRPNARKPLPLILGFQRRDGGPAMTERTKDILVWCLVGFCGAVVLLGIFVGILAAL